MSEQRFVPVAATMTDDEIREQIAVTHPGWTVEAITRDHVPSIQKWGDEWPENLAVALITAASEVQERTE